MNGRRMKPRFDPALKLRDETPDLRQISLFHNINSNLKTEVNMLVFLTNAAGAITCILFPKLLLYTVFLCALITEREKNERFQSLCSL